VIVIAQFVEGYHPRRDGSSPTGLRGMAQRRHSCTGGGEQIKSKLDCLRSGRITTFPDAHGWGVPAPGGRERLPYPGDCGSVARKPDHRSRAVL